MTNKKIRKRLECPTCKNRLMQHIVLIDEKTGEEYWRKCFGCKQYKFPKYK